jgi:hypothetical protein
LVLSSIHCRPPRAERPKLISTSAGRHISHAEQRRQLLLVLLRPLLILKVTAGCAGLQTTLKHGLAWPPVCLQQFLFGPCWA